MNRLFAVILFLLALSLLLLDQSTESRMLWGLANSTTAAKSTTTTTSITSNARRDSKEDMKFAKIVSNKPQLVENLVEGSIRDRDKEESSGHVYLDSLNDARLLKIEESETAEKVPMVTEYCSNSFFSIISIPTSLTGCSSYLRQKMENLGILSKILKSFNSEFTVFIDNNHDKFIANTHAPTTYSILSTCNISYQLNKLPVMFRSLNASMEWLNACSLSDASAEEVFHWGNDPIESERRSHITRVCLAQELVTSTYIDLEILPYNVNNILSNTSYSVAITIWDKVGFNFEFSNSIFCLPSNILKSISKYQDEIIREHVAMKMHHYKQGMRKKKYSPMYRAKHRLEISAKGVGANSHSEYALQELSHPVIQHVLSNVHISSLKFLAQNAPGDLRSRRLIHLLEKFDLSHYYIVGDRTHIGHASNYNTFANDLLTHAQYSYFGNDNFYKRSYQPYSINLKHFQKNVCSSAFAIIGDGPSVDCCAMIATRQYQEMVLFHAMQFAVTGISKSMKYYVIRQSPCGKCDVEIKRINELLSIVARTYQTKNANYLTSIEPVDNYVVFASCLKDNKIAVNGYESFITSPAFQANDNNLQSNLLKLCLAMKLNATYISLNSIAIDKRNPDVYMKEFVAAPSRTSFHYGARSALSSSAFCLRSVSIGSVIRSLWQRGMKSRKFANRQTDDNVVKDKQRRHLLSKYSTVINADIGDKGDKGDKNKKILEEDSSGLKEYIVEINYDKKKRMNVYKRVKKNRGYNDLSASLSSSSASVPFKLNTPGVDISEDKLADEFFLLWRRKSFMLLTSNDHNVDDFYTAVDDALHFDHKFIFVTQPMVDKFNPLDIKDKSKGDVTFLHDAYLRDMHYGINVNVPIRPRSPPMAFKMKSYFYLAVTFLSVDYNTMFILRQNDTDATVNHNADPDAAYFGASGSGGQVRKGDVESILNMLPPDILAGLELNDVG